MYGLGVPRAYNIKVRSLAKKTSLSQRLAQTGEVIIKLKAFGLETSEVGLRRI